MAGFDLVIIIFLASLYKCTMSPVYCFLWLCVVGQQVVFIHDTIWFTAQHTCWWGEDLNLMKMMGEVVLSRHKAEYANWFFMIFFLCFFIKFMDVFPFLPFCFVLIYRVIQILRAASDGCRSRPWLACWPASGPLYSRCFQTLTLLFHFIFRVDGHTHRRTFAKQRR